MQDENKNPFAEEEEIDLEGDVAEGEFDEGLEEGIEEEAGEELATEFESPLDALSAALDEHGADPQALMDWFQEYGYELVSTGEAGMEEEEMEGPPDLVGLRTSVVEKLGPMLGGEK
tara:strand:+ start:120 stop:470 length:351 start_codon:yes stop_codon:yes gene_type:complete